MNIRRQFPLPKEWHPMLEAAIAAGWELTFTKKAHIRWKAPSGAIVITSGTPSDRRAFFNARSNLRRFGLNI